MALFDSIPHLLLCSVQMTVMPAAAARSASWCDISPAGQPPCRQPCNDAGSQPELSAQPRVHHIRYSVSWVLSTLESACSSDMQRSVNTCPVKPGWMLEALTQIQIAPARNLSNWAT